MPVIGPMIWRNALSALRGFLEESPGVLSSTRLIAVVLTSCVAVVTATICLYVLLPHPASETVMALAAVITALTSGSAWAIAKRGNGDA